MLWSFFCKRLLFRIRHHISLFHMNWGKLVGTRTNFTLASAHIACFRIGKSCGCWSNWNWSQRIRDLSASLIMLNYGTENSSLISLLLCKCLVSRDIFICLWMLVHSWVVSFLFARCFFLDIPFPWCFLMLLDFVASCFFVGKNAWTLC